MLFDDSREEILQNIYKYAQNGCKPYCTKFDYIPEFENFIAPDRKELEHLHSISGKNCITAFYDDNVDIKRSGLNRRVHNGTLLQLINQKLGNKSKQFIKDVGLKNISALSGILYGTTYTPMIRDMGKDTTGLCLHGNNNYLLLYTSGFSPLHTLMSFYHEMGHTLFDKLKLNQQNNETIKLLRKRAANASPNKKTEAQQAYLQEEKYLLYINESSAEVFGTIMTLLRTKTEREYQTAAASLIEYAAHRMFNGSSKGSPASAYQAYSAIKQVIQMFDRMGRRGRAEFGKENGRFSLDKIAKFSHLLTKNNSMTREEYKNYYNTPPTQINQHIQENGYSWIPDFWEATDLLFQNRAKIDTLHMSSALAAAKSHRQIYDTFHKFSQQVPEAMSIYEVYKQHNPKARAYDKLRKAQEFLGVDKLFGQFAEKRRQLGATIMKHINAGRI